MNDRNPGLKTGHPRRILSRINRWLHSYLSRVPVFAPTIRVVDRVHLCFVAKERYDGGSDGRDYLEEYAVVILPVTRGRVLDLGCGHGYLTYEIARRPEVTIVVGIDRITDFRCTHPKITYRTQDLTAGLRLRSEFDVVVATEFIEHIPEAVFDALMPEIREVLCAGGIFIGSTPINPTLAKTFSGSPYHYREYQYSVLRALLERYFTDVLIEEHPTGFMTWIAQKPIISGGAGLPS